jgi:hypothetical protein
VLYVPVAVKSHSKNCKYSTSLGVIPFKVISANTFFILQLLTSVISKSFSSHVFTELKLLTCNVVASIGVVVFVTAQVK